MQNDLRPFLVLKGNKEMEERHKLSIDVQTRILPLIDNLVVPQNPAIVPNVPGVPNPSIIPTIPSTPPIIPGVQIPSVPGGNAINGINVPYNYSENRRGSSITRVPTGNFISANELSQSIY